MRLNMEYSIKELLDCMLTDYPLQDIVNELDKHGYTLFPNEPVYLEIPDDLECSCGNCEERRDTETVEQMKDIVRNL